MEQPTQPVIENALNAQANEVQRLISNDELHKAEGMLHYSTEMWSIFGFGFKFNELMDKLRKRRLAVHKATGD